MKKIDPAEIFIDIETIPSQDGWVRDFVADTIKPPGNMKKQETIDKWIVEEKENAIQDALSKCSFDGAMSHIICIGVAIDDHSPVAFSAKTAVEERGVLQSFFDYLMNNLSGYGDTFIGHNIALFDFRMIRQRAMVLGIKAPEFMPFDAKPWDDKIYDTLHRWDSRKEAMIGLDKLCRAFGVPGKAGFDGSMVYQAFQNGLHEQIADYCKGDVERVRAVYRRMHGAS